MAKFKCNWVRDLALEQFYASLGVEVLERTLKISDLAVEKSKHNNARLSKPIDENVVIRYATDMEHGTAFPFITVAFNIHTKEYEIWAGNHRVHAADMLDQEEVQCYVIFDSSKPGKPSTTKSIITRSDNRRHGVPQDDEEMLLHALFFHEEHKMKLDAVAQIMHVPSNRMKWFEQNIKAIQLMNVANKHGAKVEKLNRSHFIKLSKYADDTSRLVSMCKLVAEHDVTSDELGHLITELSNADSLAKEAGILKKFKAERSSCSSRKSSSLMDFFVGKKSKCLTNFLTTCNGNKEINFTSSGLNIENLELIKENWKIVKSIMDRIIQEGDSIASKRKK